MPVTTFSTDNVRQSSTSFKKLKLEHGEVARIVCIEQGPTFEWVHRVQKPRISPVTGRPVMVTQKRKNGEEYSDYDMEFIGAPICLGDPDVLSEKGIDAAKCPLCKESLTDEAFYGPQRRFAIHILRYATKTGTPNITEPFSVETLVWVLSDNRFASLASIFTEWAAEGQAPDPRRVDLILGPCTNAGFQNYDIKAGQKCEWLQSEDRKRRALTTYKENHAPDLSPYCGRVTEARWLTQMIEEVKERFDQIRAGGVPVGPVDVTDTLDSSLLDSAPTISKPAKDAVTPPSADALPEDDPLNEFKPGGSKQDTLPKPTSAEENTATTPDAGEEVTSFDDLMASLNV